MTISTKGRYALRVLIELAESDGAHVPLKQIAERQDISQKYLESITSVLSKAGFIEGTHGKGGGYRLAVDPSKCTVADVISVVEGDFAPVACLKPNAEGCKRAGHCKTLPMWQELYATIKDFFSRYTIADLSKH